MRVIGLDPGMQKLGVSAIELIDDQLSLINYGLIAHPRDSADSYNKFLNAGIYQIVDWFPKTIDLVRPDFIYSELVPPGRLGMNSELVVAAITTCKVIAYQFGIDWYDIAANTVKKSITTDATASKAVVRNAVIQVFPELDEEHKKLKKEQKEKGIKPVGIEQDVFDSISIGITGLKLRKTEHDERSKSL